MVNDNSMVKTCMAFWCRMHEKNLGVPYMTQWGKDQKIMKEIALLYGMNKTTALIASFFDEMKKDEFLKKTGASVGILRTQIPKLLLKLNEKKISAEIGTL